MGIIYRHQKQEPLTIEEMDGNFAELDKRLKSLETSPVLAEGIGALKQEGDQVIVQGTLGTIFGRFVLPKIFPNPRGKWEPQIPYSVLDWVQVERGIYSCTVPHTSQNFHAETKNWVLVFEG